MLLPLAFMLSKSAWLTLWVLLPFPFFIYAARRMATRVQQESRRGQERLAEAAKHGFKRAIVPKGNAPKAKIAGMQVTAVSKLADALAALELFQNSTDAPVNGQQFEGFVGEIPTQADVERSVIDDIRSSDQKLAKLIESHRHDLDSREVQST